MLAPKNCCSLPDLLGKMQPMQRPILYTGTLGPVNLVRNVRSSAPLMPLAWRHSLRSIRVGPTPVKASSHSIQRNLCTTACTSQQFDSRQGSTQPNESESKDKPRRSGPYAPEQEHEPEHEPEQSDQSSSMFQRLKTLTKKYGWLATGVYLGLSALDFPLSFLFVRWVGADKIAVIENKVVNWFKSFIPGTAPDDGIITEDEKFLTEGIDLGPKGDAHKAASLGTQLALAYAIHKSLIFLRIPITLAITPKLAKALLKRGYQITPKKAPK